MFQKDYDLVSGIPLIQLLWVLASYLLCFMYIIEKDILNRTSLQNVLEHLRIPEA